jgi:hypothetical protein
MGLDRNGTGLNLRHKTEDAEVYHQDTKTPRHQDTKDTKDTKKWSLLIRSDLGALGVLVVKNAAGTGHEVRTRVRSRLRSPPVQSNESGRNRWKATTYGGKKSGPDTFVEKGPQVGRDGRARSGRD